MTLRSVLISSLSSLAIVGSSSAAVISSSYVQNLENNWTHLPGVIANGVVASQKTTASGGVPARAIDGNYNGNYSAANSTTHTDNTETNGWWQVDLGSARPISDVTLFNRTDCCGGRLSNYSVLASNDATFASTLYDSGNQGAAGVSASFSGIGVNARYLRVQRNSASIGAVGNAISLAEVDIIGAALYNYANIAIGSTASQSTTLANATNPSAAKAIDGNLATAFNTGSTSHTDPAATGAVFWETTLATLSGINEISIYNRGDCCPERLSNFRVSIYDGASEVWGQDYFTTSGNAGSDNAQRLFSIQEDAGGYIGTGDRVRIELIGGVNGTIADSKVLSLREVQIYGVAVPEPTSFALLSLACAAFMRRRR